MKKYIIILIGLVAGILPCTAQRFVDTSRPANWLRLGLNIGDGLQTIRQNFASEIPDVTSFTLTPGNRFTAGATALMDIRNFFGIGTGIEIAVNNYDYTLTMLNANADGTEGSLSTIYTENHFYTLDIPVFLNFTFNLGSRVQWATEGGIYLSFGLGGNTDNSAYLSYANPLGQSQVSHVSYTTPYYSQDKGMINRIVRTDAGLHFATGFVYDKHWTLKCVFQCGARNLARNFGVLNTSVHNMSLTVKAGYLF